MQHVQDFLEALSLRVQPGDLLADEPFEQIRGLLLDLLQLQHRANVLGEQFADRPDLVQDLGVHRRRRRRGRSRSPCFIDPHRLLV